MIITAALHRLTITRLQANEYSEFSNSDLKKKQKDIRQLMQRAKRQRKDSYVPIVESINDLAKELHRVNIELHNRKLEKNPGKYYGFNEKMFNAELAKLINNDPKSQQYRKEFKELEYKSRDPSLDKKQIKEVKDAMEASKMSQAHRRFKIENDLIDALMVGNYKW